MIEQRTTLTVRMIVEQGDGVGEGRRGGGLRGREGRIVIVVLFVCFVTFAFVCVCFGWFYVCSFVRSFVRLFLCLFVCLY